MDWVLDEMGATAFTRIDTLVELAEAAGPPARAEIVAIIQTLEVSDGRTRARFAMLLPPEIRASRARAELATTPPPRLAGTWLAMLPDAELDAALAPYLERAFQLPDRYDGWDQVTDLVRALPEARADAIVLARFEQRAASPDFDATEAYSVPSKDPEIARRAIACELAAPSVYAGWRLGSWAADLPEVDREPIVDEAIAAFARIAAIPTSPGNDAGPFCELAALLDAERVHRALAIVARMAETPGWEELDTVRSSLACRFAELGCFGEAEALAASIVDPLERGYALGGIAARRQPWAVGELGDASPERFLDSVSWALTATPPPEVIVDCMAIAATTDDPAYYADLLGERWQHPLSSRRMALAERVHAVGGDAALVEAARIIAAAVLAALASAATERSPAE
ncbi:MAG: hypothetical protein ABI867_37310 [Kofleriaceae bacterium]